MIHIVFQTSDIYVLKKSFELDETLQGDIVQIEDDYAVGPLKDIFFEEGIEARQSWWRAVIKDSYIDGKIDRGEVEDNNKVKELIIKLISSTDEIVWIWMAPNKHDISGYYWLISQLKDFHFRVFVLHLHNLPFINDKRSIFYPNNIFEIPAKEFTKAKKLARPVTLSEFEVDSDEWTRLCSENKGVRILDGGKKLLQYDYDFYDNELMKFITTEWQKANKIFHSFFSKSKHITGDVYLLWRLKQLITDKKIEAQGDIKSLKDFEVRLLQSNA